MTAADRREVSPLERILYLKSLPPLESLQSAELMVVGEYLEERFFRTGETLLREGEPVGAIYFIVDGAVRLRRRGRDVGLLQAGSPLGGLELLAGDAEGVEAVAERDTLALALGADAVLELFEEHFSIMHHMLRDACRRIMALVPHVSGDVPALMPAASGPDYPGRELDLVERIFFLRRAAPFARASINALAELSRGLAEVGFAAGTELWKQGEPGGGILLVVDGRVRCRLPRRKETFVVGPGAPLGALESIGEAPRWYDAIAETQVIALHGDVEGLLDVLEDNFEMAREYMAVLSRALIELLEAAGATFRLKPPPR